MAATAYAVGYYLKPLSGARKKKVRGVEGSFCDWKI